MSINVIKENGKIEELSLDKMSLSIFKAMVDCDNFKENKSLAIKMAKNVLSDLNDDEVILSSDIASALCKEMSRSDRCLAKTYKDKRTEKASTRLKSSHLMSSFKDILESSGDDPDSILTENANMNGNDPAAQLHRIGSEANKAYILDYILKKEWRDAHLEGWIHIHDLDYFELNPNCLQIDLKKLLKDGYSTGNGLNTEPKSILTASMLTAIGIQSSTNSMHGGQSIGNLDFALAKYVNETYRKHFCKAANSYFSVLGKKVPNSILSKKLPSRLYYGITIEDIECNADIYFDKTPKQPEINVLSKILDVASAETENDTEQAMQGLCHNLSTLNSRAGNQAPFSSVNFGLDTSEAGRLVSKSLIKCLKRGSGDKSTFIYPIAIFHVLTGINWLPGDKNYDILKQATNCSAVRFYPNYVLCDSPYQFCFLRNKKGKLLWKERERWYIKNNLIVKEELDSLGDNTPTNNNVIARIRFVNEFDVKIRKRKKTKELAFDVKRFFEGTENDTIILRAKIRGVQTPASDDRLCVGFDDRTTPARMGCRTWVESDNLVECSNNEEPSRYKFDRSSRPPYGITLGRGNFNFITINLPKLAIESVKKVKGMKLETKGTHEMELEAESYFYEMLLKYMIMSKDILRFRQELIGRRGPNKFQFIVGEYLVTGSEAVENKNNTAELWDHFSKSIGYIGIYEALYLIYKENQEDGQKDGLKIANFMRFITDCLSSGYYIEPTSSTLKEPKWFDEMLNIKNIFENQNINNKFIYKLIDGSEIDADSFLNKKIVLQKGNWSLFATPAEGSCGSFCKTDKELYGVIKNVTDKGYYTNSNHVDVREKITPQMKAKIESPFHALANAGNIFYVEADGLIGKNASAYMEILSIMKENELGYVAVNVPVDHCGVCRYNGVIPEGECCPKCGAGEDDILRVRRITGYLVGSTKRWSKGKREELSRRTKHV